MQLPQTFSGTVIHGDKIGRTIGFPTANLEISIDPQALEPGVYVGKCQLGDKTYHCLPYFGPRLIFGEVTNSFEVYIYNFDQEIYGQVLQVSVEKKLREPLDIKSLAELKAQLTKDKAAGLAVAQRPIHS